MAKKKKHKPVKISTLGGRIHLAEVGQQMKELLRKLNRG